MERRVEWSGAQHNLCPSWGDNTEQFTWKSGLVGEPLLFLLPHSMSAIFLDVTAHSNEVCITSINPKRSLISHFLNCRNGNFKLRRDKLDMAHTTACLEISVKWKALNFCGIHFPPPSRQVYYQFSRIVSTSSFPSPIGFNTIHITNPGEVL